MSGCREGRNIWWFLFTFWPSHGGRDSRWRGREVFHRRWWSSPYVWHDSVGKFWHRAVTCRRTHGNVMLLAAENGVRRSYCFNCERGVTP